VQQLNTIRPLLLAALLWIIAGSAARAQSDTTRADTVAAGTETTTAAAPGYRMTKSPTAAVIFSIVPGGGQLYNGQYIKSALFIGVGSFFAVQAIRNHTKFIEKAEQVDAIPDDDTTRIDLRAFRKREREFYRDNRDLNVAYFIGVEILSMIDAYVGAHLFDFDVDNSEDGLSSRLYLDPSRPGVGVLMRW
jgi:hypothetical protein